MYLAIVFANMLPFANALMYDNVFWVGCFLLNTVFRLSRVLLLGNIHPLDYTIMAYCATSMAYLCRKLFYR